MELVFSEPAKRELQNLSKEMRDIFISHLEKLEARPPHKHMKHGLPHHVEKVTKQARIIYDVRVDQMFILHCFASHKEYERWFGSYK